jgi:hypothetical protein
MKWAIQANQWNLTFHESVHRDVVMKVTNKIQQYTLIYYS